MEYAQKTVFGKRELLNNKEAYSDEQLIARFRASHDNKWLGALLQRYTLLLLGVAVKYLKDRDKAEDAVQQVFVKALTNFPEGEILNFKGWLYVLMRNHCLQELRVTVHTVPVESINPVGALPHNEEKMLEELTLDKMSEALVELNAEQRVAVEMFYLQRLSYEQISAAAGFSFMQVKSYIQNGKRNLRTLILKKLKKNDHGG